MATDGRRVALRVGQTLVALGLFVFLFAFYMLFFTSIGEHSAQRVFSDEIHHAYPNAAGQAITTPISATQPLPSGPAVPLVSSAPAMTGTWLGSIDIPKINLHQIIVEGVGAAQLRVGPGHYPGTSSLGAAGNSALAGHRTTWGYPFRHLDQLRVGDPIIITTPSARVLYRVTSSRVVAPTDVAVLGPTAHPSLTLTTCNPMFSAATRLVISADMTAVDRFSAAQLTPSAPVTPTTIPITTPTTMPATAAIDAAGGGGGLWPVALDATLLALLMTIGLRWQRRTKEPKVVAFGLIVVGVPLTLSLFQSIAWLLPPTF